MADKLTAGGLASSARDRVDGGISDPRDRERAPATDTQVEKIITRTVARNGWCVPHPSLFPSWID
jgi:hypothetical protein